MFTTTETNILKLTNESLLAVLTIILLTTFL